MSRIQALIVIVNDPTTSVFIHQGTEGFRNAKKGTNIAAQAVGLSVAQVSLDSSMFSEMWNKSTRSTLKFDTAL